MSTPNSVSSSRIVPPKPPVYSVLLNRISSMQVPSPSVTIARLMPRVRTAGRPNTSPSGTVAATPISAPSRKGRSWEAHNRPATHAPKPANANCASESWPV